MTYARASGLFAFAANGFTAPEGYGFIGWGPNASDTTITYTDGQSGSNLSTVSGGTVHLYAVYAPVNVNYKVEYYYMGTDGNYPRQQPAAV